MDLIVDHEVVLELKTIESILPLHEAQLPTDLKLSGKRVGRLIHSHTPLLMRGIKRTVL